MAIMRQDDLVNGGEIVVITGKVERIIIKPAEQTAKNVEYGITHVASMVVDGTWINYINLSNKGDREPNIAINTGTKEQPKWAQIQETDEVRVLVQETVKGDKSYYNAKRTGIKLVKKNATLGQAPAASAGASGGQSSYTAKPKDMSGVSTGHALNGAMNFILTYGIDPSNENITDYAKKVHNVTEKVKEAYASANPDMSAYDSGAAAGNSILNACKLVGTENDFEDGVYALAMDFLGNVVPEILKHVKGEVKQAPPAKVTRAAPAKKAVTKAAAVEKAQPPSFDDMSDDIPF